MSRHQHYLGKCAANTMAIWTIGSLIAGITASERYHRFWSIFFPLHVIFYTTIVLLFGRTGHRHFRLPLTPLSDF